jgi:hypothetical protein
MTLPKWNDIPFDSNADPNQKALEFDLQIQENGGPTVEETQRENEERAK